MANWTLDTLRIGRDADFLLVRRLMIEAGYSEAEICRRLSIDALTEIDSPEARAAIILPKRDVDGLAAFISLFLLGRRWLLEELERTLGCGAVDALVGLDLLRRHPSSPSCHSPVQVVPVGLPGNAERCLWLASDRLEDPDGRPLPPPADVVFSGHNALTREFLKTLPRSPVGDVLDLCTGTGAAALAASHFSQRVVASDITRRSVHFAAFNCRLNGRDNVETVQGDLYRAVEGRRFDRVLAHPPYVPSLKPTAVYRDGGELGDQVLQRIIEGLSRHLRPHGTFHLQCLGFDSVRARFEERVRGWLGRHCDAYDLIFALKDTLPPERFARDLVEKVATSAPGDLQRWQQLFASSQVRSIVYGALAGKRLAIGTPETRRVQFSQDCGGESYEWLFDWFDRLRDADGKEELLAAPLRLSDGVRLEAGSRVEDGRLRADGCRILNAGLPFPTRVDADAWVASFLQCCDSRNSCRQIFEAMSGCSRLPDELSYADFQAMVLALAERGVLTLDLKEAREAVL